MRGLLAVLLLLLAGCARPPFPAPAAAPVPERTAAQLASGIWSARGSWEIRQSALFELQRAKVPMTGVLALEPGKARLVGLNDLGVKLFDLTVTPGGYEENFILPDLARLPGAAEAVAASVRRIFLSPLPAPGDRLERSATEIRLSRAERERETVFVFGGPDAELREIRVRGGGEDWRARYYDYRPAGDSRLPGGIVLDDFRGKSRLILWLEEARRP